jgi:quercetin dioxygenase-like cupin family protein
MEMMLDDELEKSKMHVLIEVSEYVQNSVVTKTIIRRTTGSVSAVAIDAGEVLPEKISPFDNLLQIIEGSAEVVIDEKSNLLKTGEGIIVPAHTSHFVKANGRFKMISTIIKSGYESCMVL